MIKLQQDSYHESYYDESIRHLDVRSGENIGLAPLALKKVKPSNNIAVVIIDSTATIPTFDNFSIFVHEYKDHLLEIKESLLIMTDNRNNNYESLYLFDKVSQRVLVYFMLIAKVNIINKQIFQEKLQLFQISLTHVAIGVGVLSRSLESYTKKNETM